MANNTDEDHLGNPTHTQLENPPDEIAPTANTEAIKQNQEFENMEVHHHAHDPAAHHHKKNWKSYFWEFLMLFLAVFCGFLAEYQLEHKIERDRAKELAKSFYQELKRDSITAGVKVQNRLKQEAALKYLIPYFKDSSLANVPKKFAISFLYGVSFRTPSIFEPRTIVLEQLRNSGSLRYFKNEEFQTLTGDLTVAIKNIYDRQEVENKIRSEYITPMQIQVMDFEFDATVREGDQTIFEGVSNYEKSNKFIPYYLNEPQKIDRQRTARILAQFASNTLAATRTSQIKYYQEINGKLLQILRNEYHIE